MACSANSGIKWRMKGITKHLRDLAAGKQLIVLDMERSDIHKIAKRVGVRVKIEKFINGFYVTRMGDTIPLRTDAKQSDPVPMDKEFDFGA